MKKQNLFQSRLIVVGLAFSLILPQVVRAEYEGLSLDEKQSQNDAALIGQLQSTASGTANELKSDKPQLSFAQQIAEVEKLMKENTQKGKLEQSKRERLTQLSEQLDRVYKLGGLVPQLRDKYFELKNTLAKNFENQLKSVKAGKGSGFSGIRQAKEEACNKPLNLQEAQQLASKGKSDPVRQLQDSMAEGIEALKKKNKAEAAANLARGIEDYKKAALDAESEKEEREARDEKLKTMNQEQRLAWLDKEYKKKKNVLADNRLKLAEQIQKMVKLSGEEDEFFAQLKGAAGEFEDGVNSMRDSLTASLKNSLGGLAKVCTNNRDNIIGVKSPSSEQTKLGRLNKQLTEMYKNSVDQSQKQIATTVVNGYVQEGSALQCQDRSNEVVGAFAAVDTGKLGGATNVSSMSRGMKSILADLEAAEIASVKPIQEALDACDAVKALGKKVDNRLAEAEKGAKASNEQMAQVQKIEADMYAGVGGRRPQPGAVGAGQQHFGPAQQTQGGI